jgi:hypothetical protein
MRDDVARVVCLELSASPLSSRLGISGPIGELADGLSQPGVVTARACFPTAASVSEIGEIVASAARNHEHVGQ